MSAQWKPEEGTFEAATPSIRPILMTANKLGLYVDISREAAQDAGNLLQELGTQMTRAAVYEFDDKILNGTNQGQPMGILNAQSAIEVARSAAGSIAYADVIGLYRRMYPGFLSGAAWYCSPAVIGELLEMEDTAGSLIWMPDAGGLGASRPGYLLGAPVYVTDKCPTLGTRGDLIFANLGAYAVAVRQEVVLERTESARWFQDVLQPAVDPQS